MAPIVISTIRSSHQPETEWYGQLLMARAAEKQPEWHSLPAIAAWSGLCPLAQRHPVSTDARYSALVGMERWA